MKYYISLLILFSISTLLTSCLRSNEESQSFDESSILNEDDNDQNNSRSDLNKSNQVKKNNKIKYFKIIDPQNGMIKAKIPFPSSWQQQNDGEYSYTGPNGIKIYRERAAIYMFSNRAQTNQVYQQNGMAIQFPKSIDQVINENFMDYANKINRKLVKKYPIPQIAAQDKQFDNQRYSSMPSQKTFNVMGLEWRDPDGTSFLTILHHFVSHDNYGGYWGVFYTVLESSENTFKQSKKQYINGLLNKQINPQWLQVTNQKDMQIAQQSNIAHQGRMARIKAMGDQGTANHNARMAAMDQNMNNWRANQAAGDRSHNQFIDIIHDNTDVVDPNTGQTYKVEAGANQYWINDQNEYIKSDNSLYNPNLDKDQNNQTWTEYDEQN
ncbi:MAG: hypothetical protein ACTIJ9_16585 [Aequorivita sp.]